MESGKMKFFDIDKGFGIIVRDKSKEEIYVHHSAINIDGYVTLTKGQRLSFDIVEGQHGKQAHNVKSLLLRA
ncbi:cold-shock protein [Erysipelothrix sp. HDW6A]|uniref:cold-shock protein n=1 Tax=Erysipelothrix sp. HDW6A TaxID=2714928 RepID=UPI00140DF4A8|nr:cold shock domain-containing protein [Erysipelothrix sp. HDW6A]QIK57843.1 cold-shock protein [Erysipelothrix sp. HDW6A]